MSEHTKGPWLLVEKEHTRGAHDTQPHLEYFHIQGPQGDVDPDLGIAGFMKRADAKLIAAAPELLEALGNLWAASVGTSDEEITARLKARLLIARITSETVPSSK